MQQISFKTKVLEEINLIPEDALESLYHIVLQFRKALQNIMNMTFTSAQHEPESSLQVDALAEIAKMAQPIGPEGLARNFDTYVGGVIDNEPTQNVVY
ncbi:MAG: hypothetical protein B6242_17410 [Anaerolineaceae bacterium 4572_78]|nr:MAG: hypothetical protein B6242_17410 [Anaerolineaceae bacterium 4572_78]